MLDEKIESLCGVKRTLTITTVETWVITIRWSDAESPREDDPAKQKRVDLFITKTIREEELG